MSECESQVESTEIELMVLMISDFGILKKNKQHQNDLNLLQTVAYFGTVLVPLSKRLSSEEVKETTEPLVQKETIFQNPKDTVFCKCKLLLKNMGQISLKRYHNIWNSRWELIV